MEVEGGRKRVIYKADGLHIQGEETWGWGGELSPRLELR